MFYLEKISAVRAQIIKWRITQETIALVPTMGNLHEGHLSLIRAAQARATQVVVSLFVNPLQFGVNEDFNNYPRTKERDLQLLQELKCSMIFAPTSEILYPQGLQNQTRVEVPELSNILCGASRPGHFIGVATIVCKLLNLIQPDCAIFGEKDYQQLLIIKKMVADLNLPIKILGMPTVRENDGLAMSSRNQYLNLNERKQAPILYKTLIKAAQSIQSGELIAQVESTALQALRTAGLRPEYFSVRQAENLTPVLENPETLDNLIILSAAYLGRTRLIDNLRLNLR